MLRIAILRVMDFLNDGDDVIPQSLIRAFKENKSIVFFVNPPYGTPAINGTTGKSCAVTNSSAIHAEMNRIRFEG